MSWHRLGTARSTIVLRGEADNLRQTRHQNGLFPIAEHHLRARLHQALWPRIGRWKRQRRPMQRVRPRRSAQGRAEGCGERPQGYRPAEVEKYSSGEKVGAIRSSIVVWDLMRVPDSFTDEEVLSPDFMDILLLVASKIQPLAH